MTFQPTSPVSPLPAHMNLVFLSKTIFPHFFLKSENSQVFFSRISFFYSFARKERRVKKVRVRAKRAKNKKVRGKSEGLSDFPNVRIKNHASKFFKGTVRVFFKVMGKKLYYFLASRQKVVTNKRKLRYYSRKSLKILNDYHKVFKTKKK